MNDRYGWKRASLAAITLCGLAGPAMARDDDAAAAYARQVVEADRRHARYGLATEARPGLDRAGAYDLQRRIVAAKRGKGERITGYKAGLTNPAMQRMPDADGPVFGVLLQSFATPAPARISRAAFRTMVLECEVGFVFSRAVRAPVETVEELKSLVGSVRPVLEVPDLAFDKAPKSAFDLIATNVGAARLVLGEAVPIARAPDLAAIDPVLFMDEKEIARGQTTSAIGDPWGALRSIVNLIVGQGHAIQPGQTIITGTIAMKMDARPGAYRADYGPLGKVDLVVTP